MWGELAQPILRTARAATRRQNRARPHDNLSMRYLCDAGRHFHKDDGTSRARVLPQLSPGWPIPTTTVTHSSLQSLPPVSVWRLSGSCYPPVSVCVCRCVHARAYVIDPLPVADSSLPKVRKGALLLIGTLFQKLPKFLNCNLVRMDIKVFYGVLTNASAGPPPPLGPGRPYPVFYLFFK